MPVLPDETTLTRLFGRATVERGRAIYLQGLVRDIKIQGDRITALVIGSEAEPYQVEVRSARQSGKWDVVARCSCPAPNPCKHAGALLLQVRSNAAPETERAPLEPVLAGWLADLERAAIPEGDGTAPSQRLLYILADRPVHGASRMVVDLIGYKFRKDGSYGKGTRIRLSGLQSANPPKYLLPADIEIARQLQRNTKQAYYPDATFILMGTEAAKILEAMIRTGRAHWSGAENPPLRMAEPRLASVGWSDGADGNQTFRVSIDNALLIPTAPPWYLDAESGECGKLETGIPSKVLEVLMRAPALRPEVAARTREQMAKLVPDRPDLWPAARRAPIHRELDPVPVFTIESRSGHVLTRSRAYEEAAVDLPLGSLEFQYGAARVRGAGEDARFREGEDTIVVPRQAAQERAIRQELLFRGWRDSDQVRWEGPTPGPDSYTIMPASGSEVANAWQFFYEFVEFGVPELRLQGWEIEGTPEVPPRDQVTWRIDFHEESADWFGLNLGIVVDGERIDLRPLLVSALRGLVDPESVGTKILERERSYYHVTSGGKVVALPRARLQPLVDALREIFGERSEMDMPLRLPVQRAADSGLLDVEGFQWHEPERLKELRTRLASFETVTPVDAPQGLQGQLRDYQAKGLAWLQFLREYDFGGVLADDMGLGKTVQTLAHILIEKEAGRLKRPALIVAPTSTLPNWRREAERFAPSLRILVLHGSERHSRLSEIDQADLVLTSYALLTRDRDTVGSREYHLAVLDEAQNIKNATAAVTKVAAGLNARHRLCLTGTPVENRLTELWSLFHFLMPGLLGGASTFAREFRTPIEGRGDPGARERLIRRIRPFLLRRTKEEVATELPPKTEMVERIELGDEQRDLYESLRLSTDRRIRELIDAKGFDRSRIEILEALLRLRQVCCDPRLLSLESAKHVSSSAKRERLMAMLQELIGEGRRVLLFSQFTSMLDLIEADLKEQNIPWVRISGDTVDRETPVRRFQSGEIPLFLISLRAGGTGLNLTAADTVIHYDPWWNPAVENQATDRAYRIGQDKAVFVFKLVTSGTVEERILELQERKAALADSILAAGDPSSAMTADDLRWVLDA